MSELTELEQEAAETACAELGLKLMVYAAVAGMSVDEVFEVIEKRVKG